MRLTEPECLRRLKAARVALLSVNDAGSSPLAVPITFAVLDWAGRIEAGFAVDHKPKTSRRLRRLDLIARDDHVSLLVHDYAEDWRRLWWVRGDGTAAVVAADDDRRRAALLNALAAKYPQYHDVPPSGDVVLVTIDRITGWSGEDLLTGGTG